MTYRKAEDQERVKAALEIGRTWRWRPSRYDGRVRPPFDHRIQGFGYDPTLHTKDVKLNDGYLALASGMIENTEWEPVPEPLDAATLLRLSITEHWPKIRHDRRSQASAFDDGRLWTESYGNDGSDSESIVSLVGMLTGLGYEVALTADGYMVKFTKEAT